jgi:hypothetical protein
VASSAAPNPTIEFQLGPSGDKRPRQVRRVPLADSDKQDEVALVPSRSPTSFAIVGETISAQQCEQSVSVRALRERGAPGVDFYRGLADQKGFAGPGRTGVAAGKSGSAEVGRAGPKAKTGIAAPKMGAGALTAATAGAAPMPTMKPKKSIKPKAASTQKPAAPTPTRGGGVMKPKTKKNPPVPGQQAGQTGGTPGTVKNA